MTDTYRCRDCDREDTLSGAAFDRSDWIRVNDDPPHDLCPGCRVAELDALFGATKKEAPSL